MAENKARRLSYALASALLVGTGGPGLVHAATSQPSVQQYRFNLAAKPVTQSVN